MPFYLLALRIVKVYLRPLNIANKRLKQYNYNLAHELQTPISAIDLNLEILEDNYDKSIILDTRRNLKDMSHIIKHLLSLSEKSLHIEKEKLSLQSIVMEYIHYISQEEQDSININILRIIRMPDRIIMHGNSCFLS